jgi:hypothetical protein
MIETEIYLINFENLQRYLGNNLRNTREKFCFLERKRKCLQGLLGVLLKET